MTNKELAIMYGVTPRHIAKCRKNGTTLVNPATGLKEKIPSAETKAAPRDYLSKNQEIAWRSGGG